MIVVDTSVWIDHLRNDMTSPHVTRLREAFGKTVIVIGDLILLEILQGAQDEKKAAKLEALLRQFKIMPMLDDTRATRAARNYRTIRGLGVTIRRTIDVIIATYCIDEGLPLLHNDHDFHPFQRHLGLLAA